MAASGQFDRKAMVAALNRTVGSIKAGPQARVSPVVPTPDFPRPPGIFVTDKEAPQATVRWAFPGIRRTDPDWYAAFVANQILGGRGFTSRLMKKIQAVTAADVQRMAGKLFDTDRIVILAVGKAPEMEAGDTDHPGALKDVATLPLKRVPLRDPATLKPMP